MLSFVVPRTRLLLLLLLLLLQLLLRTRACPVPAVANWRRRRRAAATAAAPVMRLSASLELLLALSLTLVGTLPCTGTLAAPSRPPAGSDVRLGVSLFVTPPAANGGGRAGRTPCAWPRHVVRRW